MTPELRSATGIAGRHHGKTLISRVSSEELYSVYDSAQRSSAPPRWRNRENGLISRCMVQVKTDSYELTNNTQTPRRLYTYGEQQFGLDGSSCRRLSTVPRSSCRRLSTVPHSLGEARPEHSSVSLRSESASVPNPLHFRVRIECAWGGGDRGGRARVATRAVAATRAAASRRRRRRRRRW